MNTEKQVNMLIEQINKKNTDIPFILTTIKLIDDNTYALTEIQVRATLHKCKTEKIEYYAINIIPEIMLNHRKIDKERTEFTTDRQTKNLEKLIDRLKKIYTPEYLITAFYKTIRKDKRHEQ